MPTESFDDFLKEQLKDPEFKKAFDKTSARLEAGVAILKAREKVGMTRPELAHKVHMPVEAIKRIEAGGNTSPKNLTQIFEALNFDSKAKSSNPWENGRFDNFDFRKDMVEIDSTERTESDATKPSKQSS